MQVLNKHTDYAVRSLVYLALQHGRVVSSREIAEAERIPLPFVRRILQAVTKAGFTRAKEGVQGGVTLRRAADKIRLSEVINAFQGPLELSACMFRRRICPNRKSCVLRKRIKTIEAHVAREFDAITIATLVTDIVGKKKRERA